MSQAARIRSAAWIRRRKITLWSANNKCQYGIVNDQCSSQADCANGYYCADKAIAGEHFTTTVKSCMKAHAAENEKCYSDDLPACQSGLYCDLVAYTCVKEPPKCTKHADCQNSVFPGYVNAECVGGYCDCDTVTIGQNECGLGYYCTTNESGLSNDSDSCAKCNPQAEALAKCSY